MGSKSDYLENQVIESFLRGAAVYIALFTVSPSDAGGGTEVTGGSYARTLIAFDPAVAGSTSNSSQVTFPTSTAAWGTVVAFAIFDAITGGNMLYWGDITPNKTVDSGDTARFATGGLTISED